MSDYTSIPRQDAYESTIASEVNPSTTTFVVAEAPSFSLSSGTCWYTIDPGLSTQENGTVTGISSTTLTVTRGEPIYEGGGSSAQSHSGGATIIFSNNWNNFNDIATAINSKADIAGDTFTGKIKFSGTTHAGLELINLTTAERNALTPSDGDTVFDTDDNLPYIYYGGIWNDVDTGTTTPNASPTVAGKVEEATQAEFNAGTDTGGTGAQLFAPPSVIQTGLSLFSPPGIMTPYAGATAPSGWLLCDGTTGLDSTSDTTLADLFAVIGTTFGGTGAADFDLPDMRGNIPLGKDNMGGASRNRVTNAAADTIGDEEGAETHTLTDAEIPAHSHTLEGNSSNSGSQDFGTTNTFGDHDSASNTYMTPASANVSNTAAIADNTGGGGAHENMSPYMTFNYIIKK